MNQRKHSHFPAILCLALVLVLPALGQDSVHLAVAQPPYQVKRFHAQFCMPDTQYTKDLRIYGWEVAGISDGRVENGSGGISPRTQKLFCPVLTDSNFPQQDVLRAAVHGIDDSNDAEVETIGCVASAWGYTAKCGVSTFSSGSTGGSVSDPSFVGVFAVPVDSSAFLDTNFEYAHGYPMIFVRLPTEGNTRMTGYTICGEDQETCDGALFPSGPPDI